jgi:ribose 5-phosphate isomerase B
MRIGIATDHGGFALKQHLAERLSRQGHEVVDFGNRSLVAEDDYPDFALPLADAVARKRVERGIALCGSGVGVCIAANKVPGARACLVCNERAARQGVEDDDMNLLCLAGQGADPMRAWSLVQAFLAARFSGLQRHTRRVGKIAAAEPTRNEDP